jgi:hypothetical protein
MRCAARLAHSGSIPDETFSSMSEETKFGFELEIEIQTAEQRWKPQTGFV